MTHGPLSTFFCLVDLMGLVSLVGDDVLPVCIAFTVCTARPRTGRAAAGLEVERTEEPEHLREFMLLTEFLLHL
jgi:hypothetical protein